MKKQAVDPIESPNEHGWSTSKRFWVSLLVLFHLFCVALAPLAVVDPRAGLAVDAQRALRPYSESLYLLHGYRFFAPEPGPSHIIHFEVTRSSGEKIEGHFPDRDEHWPRLLYHRWFMLSETVFQHVSATLGKEELDQWQKQVREEVSSLQQTDPRAAARLESDLKRELNDHDRISGIRDALVTNIGKNLLRKYDGKAVALKLVTRVIPPPQDIEIGLKLDNERYTPGELTYFLGTVYSDSDELESITPQEAGNNSDSRDEQSSRDGQGGGGGEN